MKPENLEKASKLVKQLSECQDKLDAVVGEHKRTMASSDHSTTLTIGLSMGHAFNLNDEEYQQVFKILIAHYQVLKEFLLKQIEVL